MECANDEDQKKLAYFYTQNIKDKDYKVTEVTRIFERCDIPLLITKEIEEYTNKAFATLSKMNIDEKSKAGLKNFGLWLMKRTV